MLKAVQNNISCAYGMVNVANGRPERSQERSQVFRKDSRGWEVVPLHDC